MALDWTTAESYTRMLSRDDTSRLSTVPSDIVDTVAPYLHTYTHMGFSYRDGKHHGIQMNAPPGYICVCETRDGKYNGVSKWWWADGGMYMYSEWDMGHMIFDISWDDRIIVYDGGGWTYHDTLPDEYRWVWESMTRSI